MMILGVLCVMLLVYLIELYKFDICCWKVGMYGIDYVYMFDSGMFGLYVMINVFMYGNELCGVIVVDVLLMVGVWLVCGCFMLFFVNVEVYECFDINDLDVM